VTLHVLSALLDICVTFGVGNPWLKSFGMALKTMAPHRPAGNMSLLIMREGNSWKEFVCSFPGDRLDRRRQQAFACPAGTGAEASRASAEKPAPRQTAMPSGPHEQLPRPRKAWADLGPRGTSAVPGLCGGAAMHIAQGPLAGRQHLNRAGLRDPKAACAFRAVSHHLAGVQ
jgi:hypothetical protein